MDKSSRLDVPLEDQARAWDRWNAAGREHAVGAIQRRQATLVEGWLRERARDDLSILDAGCGAGWLCERMLPYGRVTGVDFAAEVVERARLRVAAARFYAGDLFTVPLEREYDAIVSLEVLAHVADQPALIRRFASLLRPGGTLVLATQNRPVLERWSEVGAPIPGTIRRWVDARELRALLEPAFDVTDLFSIHPVGDRGLLRIVNAPKVNAVAAAFLGGARVEALKERAMLGHTLMVRGTLRSA